MICQRGPEDRGDEQCQGYPVQVCAEQMDDLHPDWSKQQNVAYAEDKLECKQRSDDAGDGAAQSRGAKKKHDADDAEGGHRRVHPTHADEDGRARGEVGGEGGGEARRGKERVS